MTNYVKGVSDIVKALSKRAKMTADFSANPKSVYSHMHPNEQMIHVDEALEQMAKNPDANISKSGFDEAEFLNTLKKRVEKDVNMRKEYGTSLLNYSKEDPRLHDINYDLERQADAFLQENDPEFFEELEQAMHNYNANTTSMPRDEMVEQIADQLDNFYDNDMSEAFRNALANQSKKDFLKNLYADELDDLTEYYPDNAKQINKLIEDYNKDFSIGDPSTEPHKTFILKDMNSDPLNEDNYDIVYNKPTRLRALEEQIKYNELHKNQPINPYKVDDVEFELSKDPISNQIIDFPETSLNKRYHNVKIPKGGYFYYGKHKPGDYYHNILWNYINKGENKDALLDEFFKDILHRETPANGPEKFNTIKRYKDALDKRRYELDMKNKPYDNKKLNNMQLIEEYFDSLRPESFENFESKTLSPSSTERTTLRRIVHPEEFRAKK